MPNPIQAPCIMGSPIQQCVASPVLQRVQGVANLRYPKCSCGAGRCRLLTMEGGDYAGRKYFACAVKKGHGACNFFQWQDTLGKDREMNENHVAENKPHSTAFVSEEPREAKAKPLDEAADNTKVGGDKGLQAWSDEKALPPSSPIEAHKVKDTGGSDQLCPIGRLSIHEGNSHGAAARPGKCFRCGEEGHWMIECVGSQPSSCYRCGKIGHRSKDCTA